MKVVFMGTPEYSVPTLKALLASEHEVVAVYTKPDKPKGRGKKIEITPIKAIALEHQIPVYQPVNFKDEASIQEFQALKADVAVVIAYGLLLPKAILEAYPRGCVNLHASLLPKFRGASPIQASILQGESMTGVTSMQMDIGLDTGDMLLKSEIRLTGKETAGELHDVLAKISAELCLQTLEGIETDSIVSVPQGEEADYAGKITKEMGEISWNRSCREIDCQIRGLNPWPSAYTYLDGKLLKVWQANYVEKEHNYAVGQVIQASKQGLEVACQNGIIQIMEIQMEGKKRMAIADFLNGQKIEAGQTLGKE